MERKYKDGTKKDITFFIGTEIEKTPAYGLKTLFVVGLQSIENVKEHLHADISHIFFGANHSFHADNHLEWNKWENMIRAFLEADKLCSLDIPLENSETFHESVLVEYDNFIPQNTCSITLYQDVEL